MVHKKKIPEFNEEEIRAYMAVPARRKIQHMEKMIRFLAKIRPVANRRISDLLRKEGF